MTHKLTPDFFIIGAPRCGTTAMSHYLGSHPNVCFSDPKEPHYFMTDMPAMRYILDMDDYLECFEHGCEGRCLAAGEGSVWYLYSEEAISNILRYRNDARFIIMVRNPVEMVPSFHVKNIESMDENVRDFATAWSLQESRRRGHNLPRKCRDPRILDYANVGRLGSHVACAFDQIAEEQRLVIVYDDFAQDPGDSYRSVLDFLDVPYDGRTDLPRVNENRRVRSQFLLDFSLNPPPRLVGFAEAVKRTFGVQKLSILPRLRQRMMIPEQRSPLSEELRTALVTEFSSDIDLLGSLLGRDLSHWKTLSGG